MVYYPANQLLIKTEQSSQVQFCTPLQATLAAASTTPPSGQHEQYELLQTPQQRQLQLQQQQLAQEQQHSQEQQTQIANYQQQLTFQQQNSITSSSTAAQRIKAELPYHSSNPAATSYQVKSSAPSATTKTPTTTGLRKPNPNKPQFKCDQCGMTFGSKSAHTSHTKSHAKNSELGLSNSGVGPSVLDYIAPAIELNEAGLPLGIPKSPTIKPLTNVAAGADPYQCNVCQKTFAVPARLIRHYRTHTGERPFECEFCHKLFSVKENLQVHRRIHTKERPYKCDVCGRAFEHSGKLHRHMRIHTGERPHKCSVCEKTFIQSGQLVIHMRTHTGEKPYKCPVEGCGKGFTCSKQLKVHSRTHTGEKPYHCDICFRDFGYNHVLKLHRVQHYGAKCYKCTICDETFKSKKEMEAHIKGHANELPDDEAESTVAPEENVAHPTTSESSSHSPPSSPPEVSTSSSSISALRSKKVRQSRNIKLAASASAVQPASPGSPRSIFSPSHSLASHPSLGSPSSGSTISSPPPVNPQYVPHQTDVDPHSCDSGVSSAQPAASYADEDLPTDLSMQQHQPAYYQAPNSRGCSTFTSEPTTNFVDLHPQQPATTLTINPALLEAANMARRNHDNDDDDVQTAAWQMMQLRRGHAAIPSLTASTSTPTSSDIAQPALHVSDLAANYDDTHEANVLIEHFKRGDLARHGLHQGFAPVPKFQSSLINSDIVRRVEAAIGLRSSTESPERSSSPESDSLIMANRNVMTLPLRKRKHYMNESDAKKNETPCEPVAAIAPAGESSDATGPTTGSKVMRMSSVIQFAKAS